MAAARHTQGIMVQLHQAILVGRKGEGSSLLGEEDRAVLVEVKVGATVPPSDTSGAQDDGRVK